MNYKEMRKLCNRVKPCPEHPTARMLHHFDEDYYPQTMKTEYTNHQFKCSVCNRSLDIGLK
jgi:hypothetical protein